MKLPGQPPQYNPNFEQQRSGIIERAFGEVQNNTGRSLSLIDAVTAPSPATGRALIYVDSADGALKVVFSNGTVKTLATNP